jgi:hypothetical protein
MKINWLNTIVYLGIFIFSGLFAWWLIKYLCIVIAWLMMCL